MAGRYDIEIEQGATWRLDLTWKDEAGDPIDLSGFSARMHVRATMGAAAPLVSLTSEDGGGITLGGLDGKITLALSALATGSLPPGRSHYDLELVQGDEVTRLLAGYALVSREITR